VHQQFTTEFSVTGTAGSLEHSSRAERGYVADFAAGPAASGLLPETDPAEDPYFLELREFLSAFAGGPDPRVDCADGAVAVGLATAALESLSTGQPVDLAPTGA
jgi:myo-inositol 2-dehydrogenase/D-chiro-inositol 1-dehydrogenase